MIQKNHNERSGEASLTATPLTVKSLWTQKKSKLSNGIRCLPVWIFFKRLYLRICAFCFVSVLQW